MKSTHPQLANFMKKQKEEEWSYIPSFLKSKPTKPTSSITVQSIIFDSYPKKYNELRKCCIVCETKGIKVWDCDDNTKVEEVFSYPVNQNVIPLYAKFRKQYPPLLYFVTNNNQLVSIQIKDTDVIATSFFSYHYCDFDIEDNLLFAFTNDCQLHVYDITNTQAVLIYKTNTIKYTKDTHPIALSSAYLAYPTYDIPESYKEPPESAAAKTQETISNSITWLTDGVKSMYGTSQTQSTKKQVENEEDVKKEFVMVVDFRELVHKKEMKKICHFCATSSKIRMMTFNPKGDLLAVCDEKGYLTNIFRIYPDGELQHLFVLKRGTTIATITDLTFSNMSDLFVLSSSKTSHVFKLPPIINHNYHKMNETIVNGMTSFNTGISYQQSKEINYNLNQNYTDTTEERKVEWINSSYKIHSNNDYSIKTIFNENKLLQGVSHQLHIYDYTLDKCIENGHFNLDKPCDEQYINVNLLQLQTKIGEIDDYKTMETRLIPFDESKIKKYKECDNVFAIGNEQIERQKMKLEENMNAWISATSMVFDVDYCVSSDSTETLESSITKSHDQLPDTSQNELLIEFKDTIITTNHHDDKEEMKEKEVDDIQTEQKEQSSSSSSEDDDSSDSNVIPI